MARVLIGGVEYPVAVTFKAITDYLEAVGEDSAEGMANFSKLPPSRYAALITACVNEGLRKEGREERLTVDEVSGRDFMEVSAAITAVFEAMVPRTTAEDKKKD